jgi:hypothetical protein
MTDSKTQLSVHLVRQVKRSSQPPPSAKRKHVDDSSPGGARDRPIPELTLSLVEEASALSSLLFAPDRVTCHTVAAT